MKLNPIIPKKSAAAIFPGLISSKRDLKNKIQKIAKIPVFNTGTIIDAKIDPRVSFLFFKALKTNPATTPATVVLSKQARIVPTGLTEKK